jgi:hypothetical protein
MLVLDPHTATSAASPLQPLDGRPTVGKPGEGNATSWGAAESFFSLLTQCGCPPEAPVEPAPPAVAAPVQAMPFFGAPAVDPEADARQDGSGMGVDGAAAATVPAAATLVPMAAATIDAAPAARMTDGTNAAPCALTVWPPYGAAGPAAAARPIKAPIVSGYRPWIPAEAEPAPSLDGTLVETNRHGGLAAATLPPNKPSVPATTVAAAPTAAASTAEPEPGPPAAEGNTYTAPVLATPPTSTTPTEPANSAAEPPTGVHEIGGVETGDTPAGDNGSPPQQPRQDGKAAASAVATTPAAGETAAVTTVSGQEAMVSLAGLSVLAGAKAAVGRATPATGSATGSPDPALGNTIRAQLLAEVAAQSAGATGHEKILLQLEPEHLGKVQVQLQANGSRLEIIVQAQNAETEHALAEGAHELMEAIVGRGEGRWQQVEVRFERSPHDREQRQHRDDSRDGGQQRRGNQQGRRRDERAEG